MMRILNIQNQSVSSIGFGSNPINKLPFEVRVAIREMDHPDRFVRLSGKNLIVDNTRKDPSIIKILEEKADLLPDNLKNAVKYFMFS